MRIVDRKTFMSMPAGTIFSEYEPQALDGWQIKADTLSMPEDDLAGDFVCLHLNRVCLLGAGGSSDNSEMFYALENDPTKSFPIDYTMYGRDGMFVKDQLYAVMDRSDVLDMITHLQKALAEGYKD